MKKWIKSQKKYSSKMSQFESEDPVRTMFWATPKHETHFPNCHLNLCAFAWNWLVATFLANDMQRWQNRKKTFF